MKITISSITRGKEGEGQHGHWVKYDLTFPSLDIFEPSGEKHTFTKASTFDDSASTLKAGDLIETETEINGKYLNLKKITKVNTEPAAVLTPSSPGVTPPKTTSRPPPSGEEKGMWWKELGEMIRAEKTEYVGREELENAYWQQMRQVLGLSATHTNPPKTENNATETPPQVKSDSPVKDVGTMDKEMLLNSIKHRLKFTTDNAALQWLKQLNKIPEERIENESEAVYKEMCAKYSWS